MASRSKEQEAKALLDEMADREAASQQAAANRRLTRATATAAEWKALARAYLRDLELAEARLEALLAVRETALPDRVVVPLPKRAGKHSASTACIVASDWHVEERVDSATVNGLNRFDLDIADERIDNFWRNGLRLVNGARSDATIRTLILFALGDFYSGWIHDELKSSTALSPVESILWLRPRITSGLDFLAKSGDFDRIEVVAKVGNHSRLTEKQHASPERVSLEWLLYQELARHYQAHPIIRWNLTPSYHTLVKVGGVTLRAHHGDAFRFAGGVGGLAVPLAGALNRWDRAGVADFTVCGHWHQYTPGARALVNGSLIGASPYSMRFGGYERPQQAFFCVSEKYRRVTLQAPVFVD